MDFYVGRLKIGVMLITIIATLIFTAFAAAAMGWAAGASGSRKAFDRDKAKFEAGQGRDPARRWLGPHLPYRTNALRFALIIAPLAYIFMANARTILRW